MKTKTNSWTRFGKFFKNNVTITVTFVTQINIFKLNFTSIRNNEVSKTGYHYIFAIKRGGRRSNLHRQKYLELFVYLDVLEYFLWETYIKIMKICKKKLVSIAAYFKL